MISHDSALDLGAAAIDFELTGRERASLDAHLATCPTCRAEIQAIQGDAAGLRRLPPIAPPAWVAQALLRKRRPIGMLLVAAVLVIGGSIGAVALAGSALDRTRAEVVPSKAPNAAPASPRDLPSTGPTLAPLPVGATVGWSAGPDMSVGRAFHVAARLNDGRVLIAGGGLSGHPIRTAELYDPATDAFGPAAPMNEIRWYPSATLLPDGRVLMVGGSGNSAETYDPANDTWSLTGPMLGARTYPEAVLLLDGRVLVVGGVIGNATSLTAEIFDPTTNAWTGAGPMSNRRTDHTVTLLPDGRVLVAGGVHRPGGSDAIDTVEIFDPVLRTFAAAPPMNHARARHTATLLADGRVLVACGIQGPDVLNSAEVFDAATSTWTDIADANEPREAFTATLLSDGRVLIVGGYSQGAQTTEVYDPISGTWQMTGDTATRGYHTATLLLDGRVLVTGGLDDSQTMQASTELWLSPP
jgi:anti-sigma factor RsiW